MEYTDEELEIANQRIKRLEQDVAILQDHLSTQLEALKETQRYLIKLAHSQMELNKRMASWPFIKTPAKAVKGTKDV